MAAATDPIGSLDAVELAGSGDAGAKRKASSAATETVAGKMVKRDDGPAASNGSAADEPPPSKHSSEAPVRKRPSAAPAALTGGPGELNYIGSKHTAV